MATVNSPTYYGPVPTGGSTSTAIDTQTTGSLSVFVQQPCDQSPACSTDGTDIVVEEWKGPYGVMSKLQFGSVGGFPKLARGMTMSEVHPSGSSSWVRRFSSPGDPTKLYLDEFSVRQLESGDHAILRMTFKFESSGPSPTPVEVPGSETWNVTWQPYSVSPYAFCANDNPEAHYAGDQNAGEADKTGTAYAQHIKDCIQQPADSGQQLKQYYNYMNTTTGGRIYTLNYMERRIMDKVLQDVSPTYHFPVLTKTTVFQDESANLSFTPELGGGIDVATSNLPNRCPYTFNTDQWKQWLKVGDSVSISRKAVKEGGTQLSATINTYTRTETWWGMTSCDLNFYGPTTDWVNRPQQPTSTTRWIVGKM